RAVVCPGRDHDQLVPALELEPVRRGCAICLQVGGINQGSGLFRRRTRIGSLCSVGLLGTPQTDHRLAVDQWNLYFPDATPIANPTARKMDRVITCRKTARIRPLGNVTRSIGT